MIDLIITVLLASIIMVVAMAIGIAITMPLHGALVRLRANYNPRAVGLEGTENRWAHRSNSKYLADMTAGLARRWIPSLGH